LVDRAEERNQNRNDYTAGYMTLYDVIAGTGKDPEAVYERRAFEKGLEPGEGTTWDEVFMPPQGLQGQGEGKVPGNGRTPDGESGKTTPERQTKPKVKENK
jgi:hypothetical protein